MLKLCNKKKKKKEYVLEWKSGISSDISCYWWCIPALYSFPPCPQEGTFAHPCRSVARKLLCLCIWEINTQRRTEQELPSPSYDVPCWNHHLQWCQTAMLKSHELISGKQKSQSLASQHSWVNKQSRRCQGNCTSGLSHLQTEGKACVTLIC